MNYETIVEDKIIELLNNSGLSVKAVRFGDKTIPPVVMVFADILGVDVRVTPLRDLIVRISGKTESSNDPNGVKARDYMSEARDVFETTASGDFDFSQFDDENLTFLACDIINQSNEELQDAQYKNQAFFDLNIKLQRIS